MTIPIPSPTARQYVYGIVLAAIPVLVIVGVIKAGDIAMYLNLAAAILGLGATAQASVALNQQRTAKARKVAKSVGGAHPHPKGPAPIEPPAEAP